MAGEWRINSSCYRSEYHRGVAEHAEKAFRKLCDLSVSAVQSIRLLLIHPNMATWVISHAQCILNCLLHIHRLALCPGSLELGFTQLRTRLEQ